MSCQHIRQTVNTSSSEHIFGGRVPANIKNISREITSKFAVFRPMEYQVRWNILYIIILAHFLDQGIKHYFDPLHWKIILDNDLIWFHVTPVWYMPWQSLEPKLHYHVMVYTEHVWHGKTKMFQTSLLHIGVTWRDENLGHKVKVIYINEPCNAC